MENSLSYDIFSWYFATTGHIQQIIFTFLVRIKLVLNFFKSFLIFLTVSIDKFKKISYLNYMKRR